MTQDERQHLERVQSLGCIVCFIHNDVYSPAEIHHVLDGGKRLGHMHVLPLCVQHHRGGGDGVATPFVSRHPYKARFEARYGTERELLEVVKEALHD